MLFIDAASAERYLRDAGRLGANDAVEISRLAGGVSNEVLYVAFRGEPARDFVLKQARQQLRVADPWFCGVDRIWREVEVLRICERVLAARADDVSRGPPLLARTPRIVFEDRENYCFGMEAAPREHTVWKRQLLHSECSTRHSERSEEPPAAETLRCAQGDAHAQGDTPGESDADIAEQCGRLLGTLHGGTWGDSRSAPRPWTTAASSTSCGSTPIIAPSPGGSPNGRRISSNWSTSSGADGCASCTPTSVPRTCWCTRAAG